MTDLFNNPKNNYVDPGLAPCIGNSDDKSLEFVNDGIGIVSGTKILSKIDFGSFNVPVNSYSNESKILGPGEITYISGLTRGLRSRKQSFFMPNSIGDNDLNPFFMKMDISIAYYKNFRYYEENIQAVADYNQNINIQDAVNIKLG